MPHITYVISRPIRKYVRGGGGSSGGGSLPQEPRARYWCDPSQASSASARRYPSVLECVDAGFNVLPEGTPIEVGLSAYLSGEVEIEDQAFDLSDSPPGYAPIRIVGGDQGYATYFILTGTQPPEATGLVTVQSCIVLLNTGDYVLSTGSALRFESCLLGVYAGNQPAYLNSEAGYFEIKDCTFAPYEDEAGCSVHFGLTDVGGYGAALQLENSSLYTQVYEGDPELAGAGGPAVTLDALSRVDILGDVSWRFLNNTGSEATFIDGSGLVSLRGVLRVHIKSETAKVIFAAPGITFGSAEFGNPGGRIEISLELGTAGSVDASALAGLPVSWLRSSAVSTIDTDRALLPREELIDLDTSGGSVVVDLPPPAHYPGLSYLIRRTSADNAATLDAAALGGQIDGADTYVLPATAYATVQIRSNGVEWIVLGSAGGSGPALSDAAPAALAASASAGAATTASRADHAHPLDADLIALAGISTAGILARTGAGTAEARTIVGTAPISVSDGDGVAGNPTISIALATEAAKGAVYWPVSPAAIRRFCWPGQPALTVVALTAGVYRARPCVQDSTNSYASIRVEVTTQDAVPGNTATLVLLKCNSDGSPGDVIGYKIFTVDATGEKTLTSFVEVDSSWWSAGRFAPRPGEGFWAGIWAKGTVSFRGGTFSWIWRGDNLLVNGGWTLTTTYGTGVPTDDPALAIGSGNTTPMIAFYP